MLLIKSREIQIQEDSGKRYARLSQKTREWMEVGTFGATIRIFQKELEKKCENSLKIAENLKVNVLNPLVDFVNYQTANRKFHKQNLEKSLKMKNQTEILFYKSKDKYFQKQKELLNQKTGYVILNAKDASKREAKIEKIKRLNAEHCQLEHIANMPSIARKGGPGGQVQS